MAADMPLSSTLALACELIDKPSLTPDDAGCQALMSARLEAIGFEVRHLRFDDVDNFWAVRGDANSGGTLAFAGHTDVVPTGNVDAWQHPPFKAQIVDGQLCGRGAADMKGSLAAMMTAAERFVGAHGNHRGRLAFLITSDEEGVAINGTRKVVEMLQREGEPLDWCVVGEPSSTSCTGDTIKNGRRGSLGFTLTINGIQGHVAYPQLAKNPIHHFAKALAELIDIEWDQGNRYFPATSLQISNIAAGTGATNVIPGDMQLVGNFRYSTELDEATIKQQVTSLLDSHGIDYAIDWRLSGEPFLTPAGELVDACTAAIKVSTGIDAQLSTAGGTSDGRFIAPMGVQVVELGPVNATIHKIDERVDAAELDTLSTIYEEIMRRLLPPR